jgi:HD-GYP domain-containing protein (c-di-GMP phosphodiesterase class II)
VTSETEALQQAEAQQKMGAAFLSAMIRVLSVATFHRLENAAVDNVVQGLLAAAEPIFEEHGRAELQTVGEHVFLNREAIRLRGDAFEHAMRLRRLFKRMGINEIALTGRVEVAEVREFLLRFQNFYTSREPQAFAAEKFDRITVRMIEASTMREQLVQISGLQNALRAYLAVVAHVGDVLAAHEAGRPPRVERVRRAVQQLCDAAEDHEGVVAAFTRYEALRGDGAAHAAAVAALSILMARRLGLPRRMISQIAMAATMHATRGALHLGCDAHDAAEAQRSRRVGQMKTAIDLSRGALGGDALQWLVCASELHDPFDVDAAQRATAIARFVAVPCAFHLLVMPPPGQKAVPPDVAVALLRDGAGTRFDPLVVRLFTAVVGLYPVGTTVRLSNGATAVVVSLAEDLGAAALPVVKVVRGGDGLADQLIDLSSAAGLHITGSVPVEEEAENPLHFLLS